MTAGLFPLLFAGLAAAQAPAPGAKIRLDIGEIAPCSPGMGQGSSWTCTDDRNLSHSCIKIRCDHDCAYAADNICYSDSPLASSDVGIPPYDVSDRYVTSPTMLVRAGADGLIKEIWSGMDAKRRRHVPLFLELSLLGRISQGGEWLDLDKLKYRHDGTFPGFIHLVSNDRTVSIRISGRRAGKPGPIVVTYSFAEPVDFRLSAELKYPWLTRNVRHDDAAGTGTFSTLWRGSNAQIGATEGPQLVFATQPPGRTVAIDKAGFLKEIKSAREIVLRIDAEDPGESSHGEESPAESRVSLTSEDPKLDRLFNDSIDAIESHQFESGDVMGDLFFYRDSWLRDGTYSMIGLALAGHDAAVKRFFSFWTAQRDFSVGGEREAQQVAIALTGLWFYSRLTPDGKTFLNAVWPYVSHYGDYFAKRVEKEGMLALAEEWICFIPAPSSWPNAEVYSGLRAAAKIAAFLQKGDESRRWNAAAERLKEQFDLKAYDQDKKRLIPMAGPPGQTFTDPDYPRMESRNGPLRDDRVDAGMLIIGRLDVLGKDQSIVPVDDPRFASTQAQIRKDLENPDHSVFRYGPNPSSPHYPHGEPKAWPIINAWAAQDEWLLGRTDLAWTYLLSGILNKKGYDAEASSYYLPENWDARGFADKPLIVWSHGDFVTSTLLLFLGFDLEPRDADLGLAPSLPPGMKHARIGNFRFRDWRLDVDLTRNGDKIDVEAAVSGARPLVIRLPSGERLSLVPGKAQRFAVDPTQYYLAFGRSRNAAERLRIASKILAGKEPAGDPAKMSPAALQATLLSLETSFQPRAK